MGLLRRAQAKWKAASLEQKVHMVLDFTCGMAGGYVAKDISRKLGRDKNFVGKVLTNVITTGLGVAAADVASKALYNEYGAPIIEAINKAKAVTNEEAKEEETNGGDE